MPRNKMTRLGPLDEVQFQDWYKNLPHHQEMMARGMQIPSADDPEHFYDYRGAYLQNMNLGPNQQGHFPSEFKMSGHPRTYLGGVNTSEPDQAGMDLYNYLRKGSGVRPQTNNLENMLRDY